MIQEAFGNLVIFLLALLLKKIFMKLKRPMVEKYLHQKVEVGLLEKRDCNIFYRKTVFGLDLLEVVCHQ